MIRLLNFALFINPPFSKIYFPFSSFIDYTNAYVKNNLHNIEWESGEFDYDHVLDHIKLIFNYKPQFIYVKGYEKVNYLLNLYLQNIKVDIPIPKIIRKQYNFICNMESDFDIPNLKQLRMLYENVSMKRTLYALSSTTRSSNNNKIQQFISCKVISLPFLNSTMT